MSSCVDVIFPMTTLEVLTYITPLVRPWYRFGLELGLSPSTLDAIEQDHRHDVHTRKRKVVREWLRKPQATWSSLVQALTLVGEESTAITISEEHKNGKTQALDIC